MSKAKAMWIPKGASPITHIIVHNAHQNNLKNISVAIPKRQLVVFTGLSGSGKSTLAMDTIYAEGQRRYIESLSTYARQFLGQMKRPHVDKIEGLSPAIAIDQKTTSHNPRSTVGTITEIYDYLRLLFARVGIAHCPSCGRELTSQSIDEIIENILYTLYKYDAKNSVRVAYIVAPVVQDKKGAFEQLFLQLRRAGWTDLRIDGHNFDLSKRLPKLDKNKTHTIEVIVGSVMIPEEFYTSLAVLGGKPKNWRAKDRAEFLSVLKQAQKHREQKASATGQSGSQDENAHIFEYIWASLHTYVTQSLKLQPSFVRVYFFVKDSTSINASMRASMRSGAKQENIENSANKVQNKQQTALDLAVETIDFSTQKYCHVCNISVPEFEPRHFSFNSPAGACPACSGLGFVQKIDEELILDKEKTLLQGGVYPFTWNSTKLPDMGGVMRALFFKVVEENNIPVNLPVGQIPGSKLDILLYGDDKFYTVETARKTLKMRWRGVIDWLYTRYQNTESELVRQEIQKYMVQEPCSVCKGARLKPESLAVKVASFNIHEMVSLSVSDFLQVVKELPAQMSKSKQAVAKEIVRELESRAQFLVDVGLGYLTLARSATTLSGGEAQRVRLASQIGIGLTDVIYVLDEPSIGLHARDQHRLIETLKRLRDGGNSVIIVEHDADTIKNADVVVDFGPGAGVHGGQIVAMGSPKDLSKNKQSVTGPYLAGVKTVTEQVKKALKEQGMPSKGKAQGEIILRGVKTHNLKNINAEFKLGVFTVVTGVSGSGKSSLVMDTLLCALKKALGQKAKCRHAEYDDIFIKGKLRNVVAIDQSPIGRTPRSNPATYTGVFTDIRNLFAQTKLAKIKGFKPGHFSFNVPGGRCEACRGEGLIRVKMQFMPDVFVTCDVCEGKRYTNEVLQVTFNGKNIYDVLEMTVDEALEFFKAIPSIKKKLQLLQDIGLGYIRLGQPAPLLSGGEAQRIKLAKELQKTGNNIVYILDEPTTGLHFEDVVKLVVVLKRLVARGNSVIVIEHNIDFIKQADYIIDLGPEGGDQGGKIVYAGPLEGIKKAKQSITARWL